MTNNLKNKQQKLKTNKNKNKNKNDKKSERATKAPISLENKTRNRMPKTESKNGTTTVTHTETYGVGATGTNNYSVISTWALQPGISTFSKGSPLGSWLPQIAQNFDNYEIEHLVFKYRTACSTLTPGLAVFGFEPNPEGTPPSTYQEIRNMYSADGSVHANLTFDISSRVKGRKLIRKGNVVNLPSYDLGKVYFCSIGVTDGALMGFVDVEYRVRLINPQSSASTTIIPTNLGVAGNIMQRLSNDLQSTYPGTVINCATSCVGFWNLFVGPAVSTGATLATKVVASMPTINIGYANGNRFVSTVGNHNTLRMTYKGRYRLLFNPRLGYEDLKMFSFIPCSHSGILLQRTVYANLIGSEIATVNIPAYATRGFTGVVTGDPNPGTDIWPFYQWFVDIPTDGFDFAILAGVLDYNSVSTTTANLTAYAGLGATTLEIEYLGPLLEAIV